MKTNGACTLLAIALALGAFSAPAPASSLLAVQPDGKIVVGGKAAPDNGFVARLTPDGNLDPTFGREGIVLGRGLPPVDTLAVQPAGRIVVAAGPWLVRYEADGQVDRSFVGPDGSTGSGYRYASIVPLASGLIAVARSYHAPKSVPPWIEANLLAPDGRQAWPVRRIDSALASDMIQLSSGNLALTGHELIGTPILSRVVLGRGHNDSSLGSEFPIRPWLMQAIAEHDRMLYTAGKGTNGLAVIRFTPDQEIDTDFGDEGLTEAEPPGGSGRLEGTGIQVQADGKAVVAAEGRLCPGCPRSWLARFGADGVLDESFGEGGFAYARDSLGAPLISRGKDVVLQPGGRSLVLGTGLTHGVVLAAFDDDGDPDRSWGSAGVRTIVPSCGGDVPAQRASGCLPSARVRLGVRRLSRKRAILDLQVRSEQPASRIASVRLLLPRRALRIRQRRAGRIVSRVVTGDGMRKGKGDLKAGRRGLKLVAGEAQNVRVRIPGAALRRIGTARGKRKLPFRLWVEFGRGEGTQRLVLRRAG